MSELEPGAGNPYAPPEAIAPRSRHSRLLLIPLTFTLLYSIPVLWSGLKGAAVSLKEVAERGVVSDFPDETIARRQTTWRLLQLASEFCDVTAGLLGLASVPFWLSGCWKRAVGFVAFSFGMLMISMACTIYAPIG